MTPFIYFQTLFIFSLDRHARRDPDCDIKLGLIRWMLLLQEFE